MKLHLGMPPIRGLNGLSYACFQALDDAGKAYGAVLFGYWAADDIRILALRFDEGVSTDEQSRVIDAARAMLRGAI